MGWTRWELFGTYVSGLIWVAWLSLPGGDVASAGPASANLVVKPGDTIFLRPEMGSSLL